MQPLKHDSSVTVVKAAADEPKELVEAPLSVGEGIEGRLYLGEELVEHGGEFRGRRAISDGCFPHNLSERSFPALGHEALGASIIA